MFLIHGNLRISAASADGNDRTACLREARTGATPRVEKNRPRPELKSIDKKAVSKACVFGRRTSPSSWEITRATGLHSSSKEPEAAAVKMVARHRLPTPQLPWNNQAHLTIISAGLPRPAAVYVAPRGWT